jgi:hypothetical protein
VHSQQTSRIDCEFSFNIAGRIIEQTVKGSIGTNP